MSNIEEKVDMSLDQLVSMRRKEKKVVKKPKKRESKATPMKIDKAVVQQTSNKMKRANQVAKRRGLATSVETPSETQKRARKAVKTTTVTLTGGKKKKKTDNNTAGVPKTISIEPTQNSRPISIKDFVLPKDTKMTISFTSTAKQQQPKKKQQQSAAKNSKVMMVVDTAPQNTASKSRRSRRPSAAAAAK